MIIGKTIDINFSVLIKKKQHICLTQTKQHAVIIKIIIQTN